MQFLCAEFWHTRLSKALVVFNTKIKITFVQSKNNDVPKCKTLLIMSNVMKNHAHAHVIMSNIFRTTYELSNWFGELLHKIFIFLRHFVAEEKECSQQYYAEFHKSPQLSGRNVHSINYVFTVKFVKKMKFDGENKHSLTIHCIIPELLLLAIAKKSTKFHQMTSVMPPNTKKLPLLITARFWTMIKHWETEKINQNM